MKHVKIKPDKNADGSGSGKARRSAPPFAVNKNGWLVHRVKHVTDHRPRATSSVSHSSVHYWCNNFTFLDHVELTDDPPRERLLCTVCEAKAVAAGLATADEMLERHIHLGEMRPHRVCHRNEQN